MHSFNGPSGATYHHNGDFSGGIRVHHTRITTHNNGDIEIPFEDLRALYLEYLRGKFINLLEEATFDEIERELPTHPLQPPSRPQQRPRLGCGAHERRAP